MQLFNTKSRKIEEFKPLKQNEVKVYHCGPTPYNFAHIWNLKAYVWNDMITRVLRFLGYNVNVLMNITDIDDKTIKNSVSQWINLLDYTRKYTRYFLEDIDKLNIVRPNNIVAISEVIPEMVRMINTMLKRWYAYLSDDNSIYYNISKFKDYWKLAHIDFSWMKTSVRINNDEYEKDQACDFVLWKAWKKSDWENFWEEEFEVKWNKIRLKGRPGWHIECSALNMKYFGKQIDIHTWWIDNLFPHHQNELAQTEVCTWLEFSKYWIHHGHLMVDGKKMAKSANNFYTLRDLEEKFSPHPNSLPKEEGISRSILYRSIRLSFINWKYRDSIDLSFSKIDQCINTISKIDETLKKLSRSIDLWWKKISWVSKIFSQEMQIILSEYIAKLEDDFNIPEALAEFHSFVKFVNTGIAEKTFSLEEENSLIHMFKTLNEVLWIMDFSVLDNININISKDILKKLETRNKAKQEKNFELADKLRDELLLEWYKIIDSRDGSMVEKI